MKKILCYSVRLQSLTSISEKAFLAKCFNGSEDIIPKSCVFGQDYDVLKSDSYWIASWLLEKKNIQYSQKKKGWFNPITNKIEPNITIIVEKNIPVKIEATNITPDAELTR